MPRKYTPEDRLAAFWAKVNKDGPVARPELTNCWVWTGATTKGYGMVLWEGRRPSYAHRLSWVFANGPTRSLYVLHRCDNPPCVRPDHLFLGTNADNVADKMLKGRNRPAFGVNCHSHKLTVAEVKEIRWRYATGNISQNALGREFGVNQSSISAIIRGFKWKQVAC